MKFLDAEIMKLNYEPIRSNVITKVEQLRKFVKLRQKVNKSESMLIRKACKKVRLQKVKNSKWHNFNSIKNMVIVPSNNEHTEPDLGREFHNIDHL